MGHLIENLHLNSVCWHDLKRLFHAFTQLKELDCSGNSDIQDLSFICENHTLLNLNLHDCFRIWQFSLITSISCVQTLTHLDLSGCDQIKEIDIGHIAKKLRLLEYFNVRDTKSLHIESVRQINRILTFLKEFLFCPLIFASDTSQWVEIYMQHPILQICPAGLEIIIEKQPHLFQ